MDISENFRIYSTPENWLEGDAVAQFKQVAAWEGIIAGAGFPDLHPGRGIPVGAAFISSNIIYPALIGSDIGCGMTLAISDLPVRKWKTERILRALGDDPESRLRQSALRVLDDMPESVEDAAGMLGTLGHGNHFAEFLSVESVEDETLAAQIGLERDKIYLLVHSGSRNYGDRLWREFAAEHAHNGVEADSAAGQRYLSGHDRLLAWSKFNRDLIVRALSDIAGCNFNTLCESVHNSITPLADGKFLHRKGAAAADGNQAVLIAGSRGSYSYLVMPQGDSAEYCYSLAHGAGRKWNRLSTRLRMRGKYSVQELQKSRLGCRVLCPDKDLLFEETPDAYKNIERIIRDLQEFKLIKVIARFCPKLNCKP